MPKLNLIIDTDVGSDDAATLCFALGQPELIKVWAISTVFGNVSSKQSVLNVYSILQMFGISDEINIYPGAEKALSYIFNAQWAGHGIRGMGNWTNPEHDVHTAIEYYDNIIRSTEQQQQSGPKRQPLTLESSLIGMDMNIDPNTITSDVIRQLFVHSKENNFIIPSSLDAYRGVILTPSTIPPPTNPMSFQTIDTISNQSSSENPQQSTSIDLSLDTTATIQNSSYIIPLTPISPPTSPLNPSEFQQQYHAACHLVEMVNTKPYFYDFLALGPLTNIALALELDSTFLTKLNSFIWMGGGLSGNSTPYAEFNAYSDSKAAQIVFEALSCIETVPIDYIENDNENINKRKKLKAMIFTWDACLSGRMTLTQYRTIFQSSIQFQWKSPLLLSNNTNNINNNTTPNQQFTYSQTELYRPIYLLPYVVRQFLSKYETILQTAEDEQRQHLYGLHQNNNNYCGIKNDDEKQSDNIGDNDENNIKHIDIQPAMMVICDLMALLLMGCPTVANNIHSKSFRVKSNVENDHNGQMYNAEDELNQDNIGFPIHAVIGVDPNIMNDLINNIINPIKQIQ